MKKISKVALITCLLFSLLISTPVFSAGCQAATPPMSAEAIANVFATSISPVLPTGKIIVYTADTDVNKLLGRPNQYISKVNFADNRIYQIDENDPDGGSIETFSNPKDLETRKSYIESVEKTICPTTVEYMFVNGNYLLRLSNELTPEQAKEYETAFMTIK
jgi:hypothetical protein